MERKEKERTRKRVEQEKLRARTRTSEQTRVWGIRRGRTSSRTSLHIIVRLVCHDEGTARRRYKLVASCCDAETFGIVHGLTVFFPLVPVRQRH